MINMGKTGRPTLDFESVVNHTFNEEHPGCTGDIQTSVLALPKGVVKGSLSMGDLKRLPKFSPMQEKDRNCGINSKLLRGVLFPRILIDSKTRDTWNGCQRGNSA